MRKKLTALFLTFCLALTPFSTAMADGTAETTRTVVSDANTLQQAVYNAGSGNVIQLNTFQMNKSDFPERRY